MEGLRTLIVDDSSVMRKIVARALQQGGVTIAEILEAGNGSEALDIIRSHKVDLVLSDINMPVMDGLEFVRQLQGVENAQGVPVVVDYLRGHPDRLDEDAHLLVFLALTARYPCK